METPDEYPTEQDSSGTTPPPNDPQTDSVSFGTQPTAHIPVNLQGTPIPPAGRMPDLPRFKANDVLGTYRLMEKLGQGGMGVVWRAWDENLERTVALKVLTPDWATQEESMTRLQLEARAIARLNHPSIVSIYSFDQKNGYPFIAMEYVEGQDLQVFLEKHGAMELEKGIATIRQAAEALEYACEQQVIHRDIKPSNIFIRTDGRAMVMDFGLAKRIDADPNLTMSGSVVGTPHYMAPEQAMGKTVDHRADIYSLACTLFTTLTAKKPYENVTPMEAMVKHTMEPLPFPKEWSRIKGGRLVDLMERMTAKDPMDRCSSWSEIVAELRAMETDAPPVVKRKKSGKRSTAKVGTTIFIILAVAAFATGALLYIGNSRGTRTVSAEAKNPGPILSEQIAAKEKSTHEVESPPAAFEAPRERVADRSNELSDINEHRKEVVEAARDGEFAQAMKLLQHHFLPSNGSSPMLQRFQGIARQMYEAYQIAEAFDQKMRTQHNAGGRPTRDDRITWAKDHIQKYHPERNLDEVWQATVYLGTLNPPETAEVFHGLSVNYPELQQTQRIRFDMLKSIETFNNPLSAASTNFLPPPMPRNGPMGQRPGLPGFRQPR